MASAANTNAAFGYADNLLLLTPSIHGLLTKDMCDDADIRAKRGYYIGSVNRLNAQFRVVPDQIRIRLLQMYCTLSGRRQ